jgi:hypothetical protein
VLQRIGESSTEVPAPHSSSFAVAAKPLLKPVSKADRGNLEEQDRLGCWSIDTIQKREGRKKSRLGIQFERHAHDGLPRKEARLVTAGLVFKVDPHLEGRVDRPTLEGPEREAMEDERYVAEGDVKLADGDRLGIIFGELKRCAGEFPGLVQRAVPDPRTAETS